MIVEQEFRRPSPTPTAPPIPEEEDSVHSTIREPPSSSSSSSLAALNATEPLRWNTTVNLFPPSHQQKLPLSSSSGSTKSDTAAVVALLRTPEHLIKQQNVVGKEEDEEDGAATVGPRQSRPQPTTTPDIRSEGGAPYHSSSVQQKHSSIPKNSTATTISSTSHTAAVPMLMTLQSRREHREQQWRAREATNASILRDAWTIWQKEGVPRARAVVALLQQLDDDVDDDDASTYPPVHERQRPLHSEEKEQPHPEKGEPFIKQESHKATAAAGLIEAYLHAAAAAQKKEADEPSQHPSSSSPGRLRGWVHKWGNDIRALLEQESLTAVLQHDVSPTRVREQLQHPLGFSSSPLDRAVEALRESLHETILLSEKLCHEPQEDSFLLSSSESKDQQQRVEKDLHQLEARLALVVQQKQRLEADAQQQARFYPPQGGNGGKTVQSLQNERSEWQQCRATHQADRVAARALLSTCNEQHEMLLQQYQHCVGEALPRHRRALLEQQEATTRARDVEGAQEKEERIAIVKESFLRPMVERQRRILQERLDARQQEWAALLDHCHSVAHAEDDEENVVDATTSRETTANDLGTSLFTAKASMTDVKAHRLELSAQCHDANRTLLEAESFAHRDVAETEDLWLASQDALRTLSTLRHHQSSLDRLFGAPPPQKSSSSFPSPVEIGWTLEELDVLSQQVEAEAQDMQQQFEALSIELSHRVPLERLRAAYQLSSSLSSSSEFPLLLDSWLMSRSEAGRSGTSTNNNNDNVDSRSLETDETTTDRETIVVALQLERQAATLAGEINNLSHQLRSVVGDHQKGGTPFHGVSYLRQLEDRRNAAERQLEELESSCRLAMASIRDVEDATLRHDQQRAAVLAEERSLELQLEALSEQEGTLAEQFDDLQRQQAERLEAQRQFQQAETLHNEKKRDRFYQRTLAQQQQQWKAVPALPSRSSSSAFVGDLLTAGGTADGERLNDGTPSLPRTEVQNNNHHRGPAATALPSRWGRWPFQTRRWWWGPLTTEESNQRQRSTQSVAAVSGTLV